MDGVVVKPPEVNPPLVPQRAEARGLRVELGPDLGAVVSITRARDRYEFRPPVGQFCEDPVVALDGLTAFVRCMIGENRGFNYHSLIRFPFGTGRLQDVTPETFLLGEEIANLTGSSRAWVCALDRVSSDGRALLLRVGIQQPMTGRHTYVHYRPYWYDLTTKRLIEPDIQADQATG